MFKNIIAKNLMKPTFLLSKTICEILEENKCEYEEMEQYLDMHDGQRVLEIGYGLGYGIYTFACKYNSIFEGVDFSKLMYNKACKCNKQLIKDKKVKLFCRDFKDFITEEETYDRIYFLNVIYFWNDLKEKFAKINKMLKRNGKVAFFMADAELLAKSDVTNTSFFNKHTIGNVMEVMKKQHFTSIQVIENSKESKCFYITGNKN